MKTKEQVDKELKLIASELEFLELNEENRGEEGNKRIDELVIQFRELRDKTPVNFPDGIRSLDSYAETTDGKSIRMLRKDEKLASRASADNVNNWSVADFVRSNMGLVEKRASLISSPATVGLLIGSQIIDDVRAKSRLIQAGSLTLPITGPTNLARIVSDPTVFQHTEGATDISESIPVLSPVELKPETLAALVPIDMALAQDSDNLDQALRTSITGAFALKLDTLGIATILINASIPGSLIGEACSTWAGTMEAITSALGENQDIPVALIANAADFGARAAELGTANGNWLGAPPILKNMLDLPTTGMSVGTALFGNFTQGVAVAIRQDLQLEMLRFGKPTAASHYLMCTLRAQIFVLQPKALYIQTVGISS